MNPKSRTLCIGAAHWDVIGRTDVNLSIGGDVSGQIEHRPGGVALNIALGLAQRGCPVSLCSAIGDDAAGNILVQQLEESGVDCSHVVRIERAATGHYIAIEDSRGELFAAVADVALLEAASEKLVGQAEGALASASTLLLETNLTTFALQQIANAGRKAGTALVANPVSPAKAHRLAFLLTGAYAPTLVANLAEANILLNGAHDTTLAAAKALQARCLGTVLVTDGGRPASLVTPDQTVTAAPQVLPGNISVTGAGDALLSAYLASPDRIDTPDAAFQSALEAAGDHMKDTGSE